MFLYFSMKRIVLALPFMSILICNGQSGIPIFQSKAFSIFKDSVIQNQFTARIVTPTEIQSNYQSNVSLPVKDKTVVSWKLNRDITAFPQYHSELPVSDAVYNLSLEEMIRAVEKDSTFRTGEKWGGVWTRDISYSIIHSMAYMQPRVAMNSLLRKVNKKKRIIQDTGTGGAYPCSTDRIIWAVAAWELYKVTGDKEWLQQAFSIIKNSIDDDLQNIYDVKTGLVKGESSFLDWREETYPAWMQPADIYESECLGTNAVHYQANRILSQMAAILHDKDAVIKYQSTAARIKKGINQYLWMPEKKYYAQYLYGRNYKILSPRSEALGEALCVLFGIADGEKARQVIAHTPLTAYGISCIYPQIPDIPPYHNNANWPFVQAYWLRAAAMAGNEKAVLESIADIYRPAALFLTNKENMVADNGDYNGTQINSSVMLWSLSGNISIVHKVLFGISFNENNLSFAPFVPKAMAGKRSLQNFKYRNTILNIELNGYGNQIRSFQIDGKASTVYAVPDDLTGIHTIQIELSDNDIKEKAIHKVENYTSLPTPELLVNQDTIYWKSTPGAKAYTLLDKGKVIATTTMNYYTENTKGYHEFSLIAIDSNKVQSFASEPLVVAGIHNPQLYEIESINPPAAYPYTGFSGKGFTETSTTVNRTITIPLEIKETGLYAIDCRYANGNGPVNTENKCAIRTLQSDAKKAGTLVFPQRGKNDWNNWGFSNSVSLQLSKGKHILTIIFEEANDNMNGEVNAAMLDYLRITRLDQ